MRINVYAYIYIYICIYIIQYVFVFIFRCYGGIETMEEIKAMKLMVMVANSDGYHSGYVAGNGHMLYCDMKEVQVPLLQIQHVQHLQIQHVHQLQIQQVIILRNFWKQKLTAKIKCGQLLFPEIS